MHHCCNTHRRQHREEPRTETVDNEVGGSLGFAANLDTVHAKSKASWSPIPSEAIPHRTGRVGHEEHFRMIERRQ